MIRVADLFCGAGGETTGIEQAIREIGGSSDVAAVNHWDIAIETHKRNHPESRSYCMSLEQLDPLSVFGAGERIDLLWASPECTHHSNARGGRPRSNQSRASAWLIMKWLSELYVRRIIIENVPEFVNWGPLGANGKPLPSGRGKLFEAFVEGLKALGYRVDWRLLCAADYGDPTTRTRFFLQAVRGHGRIAWPEPTHAQEPGLFDRAPWRAAREIIDWTIPGTSIWDRARPLAPATMRRIEAGIRRYWGEWAEPFLIRFHGGENAARRTQEIDYPIGTLDCSNRYGLVQPFILHQDAPGRPRGIGEPVPTIRGRNGHALVEPFLVHYYGNGDAVPVRIPLATVTTKDRFALVRAWRGSMSPCACSTRASSRRRKASPAATTSPATKADRDAIVDDIAQMEKAIVLASRPAPTDEKALREALADFLSFEYKHGVGCQKNLFALEGRGQRCLCRTCIEDRAAAILAHEAPKDGSAEPSWGAMCANCGRDYGSHRVRDLACPDDGLGGHFKAVPKPTGLEDSVTLAEVNARRGHHDA